MKPFSGAEYEYHDVDILFAENAVQNDFVKQHHE